MENKTKQTKEIIERFFKLRFPEKDLKFEKECGYFGEWVERFENNTHLTYSDSESLKAWEELGYK